MTLHKFLAQLTAAGLYTPPEVSHPGLGNGVPPGPPPSPGDPQAVRYAHAALVAESHKVASQPEGVRNSELVRSAYRMGQLVGSGYLDRMAVYDDLLRAAEASGLGAGEARATILSGLSAGMGAPRAVALRAEVGPAHTVVAEGASVAPPEAVEEAASVAASVASVAPDLGKRLVPGGAFIHSAPTSVPAVWGRGGEVLWAEGEPLIITGPTGVGKTTLGGMIIAGRLGLIPAVLGYPVRPGARRTLVLAMDRPAQIQRALARLLRAWPAELLDEKLIVWKGPPPADLARHPQTLLSLAEQAQADTVVIDSLKDAAVKLSDEETGQGLSRAMNLCVANQVEVLGYHHQTKRGAGGLGKPNSLADVYGSGWITAGAGSVVLLWGAAGDPIVELSHLKQPDEEVGPLRLAHDHVAGRTSVVEGADVFSLLSAGPQSAGSIASWIYGEKASEAEVAKIRRKLDRLVAEGLARRVDPGPTKGGAGGGSSGVRFEVVSGPTTLVSEAADEPSGSDRRTTDGFSVSAGRATDAVFSAERPASTDERPTLDLISAGRATDAATDATDAQRPTIAPPSIGGREVVGRRSSAAIDGAQECPRCHQSVERLFTAVLGDWPALCGVCAYPDPSTRPGAEKEEENDETDPY